ncbi:hypothetical protein Q8A73_020417 [Channa argus]|nr:hypothetical protein Q8A73_020417 [Channa argus]
MAVVRTFRCTSTNREPIEAQSAAGLQLFQWAWTHARMKNGKSSLRVQPATLRVVVWLAGRQDVCRWLYAMVLAFQAGTRDAYDSTLKAPTESPSAATIPPPPTSLLFPVVSQASQGSSDRRKSASGLFQCSDGRSNGMTACHLSRYPASHAFAPQP